MGKAVEKYKLAKEAAKHAAEVSGEVEETEVEAAEESEGKKPVGSVGELFGREIKKSRKAKEPKAAVAAVETKPESTDVEIDVDGQKVKVSPNIAKAFEDQKKAGITPPGTASDLDRIKNEIIAAVQQTAQQQGQTVTKEQAAEAAEDALDELELPSHELMIKDPEKYNEELRKVLAKGLHTAKTQARAEFDADVQKRIQVHQVEANKQALKAQFYEKYPEFKGDEEFVDPILGAKWEEVTRSGRVQKMTVPDAFREIAVEATQKMVKMLQRGKRFAAEAIPNLEGSSPKKPAPPPQVDAKKDDDEDSDIPTRSLSHAILSLKKKHSMTNRYGSRE
jgi:hypothetical protein